MCGCGASSVGDPCRTGLYFKCFFYMLILFFPGSQASIMAFEAVVTSAAALAKCSSDWEGFFYTRQSTAGPSVKLSSIK